MIEAGDFRRHLLRSPERSDPRWIEWLREEFGRRFFKVDVQAGENFRFEHSFRLLPGLGVNENISSQSFHRNMPHLAEDDDLTLFVLPEGKATLSVRDDTADLGGDYSAMIVGSDVPASAAIHTTSQLLMIKFNRTLLEPLMPRSLDLLGLTLPGASQGLRLLTHYVRTLGQEEVFDADHAHLAATHLRDLIAMAVGTTRDGAEIAANGGARAARLSAIKADILANLTRSTLTIDKIARRHGITPRYIGSLFAGIGTSYTEFVLEQRLLQAHRMLIDPRFSARIISSIAHDAGFGDLSYFNHCFRRRFGLTPSDLRHKAGTGS